MRRWTYISLACLVVGAALNVAVAWSIAWNTPSGNLAGSYIPKPRWPIPQYAWAATGQPVAGWCVSRPGLTAETDLGIQGSASLLSPTVGTQFIMAADSFGWPLPSLRRVATSAVSVRGEQRSMQNEGWLCAWLPRAAGKPVFLPTHPLSIGFAANSLVYCVMAMFAPCLWHGSGQLRRWHRRRKGLCIYCAYPVGDPAKPCPECGQIGSSQAAGPR